ncbi:uncharacterized protein LOC116920518 [Daphnia magna]|nr:uncharacterized protein LOC116920518 [Daphnia magna]
MSRHNLSQWPISIPHKQERVKFALQFVEKEIPFWLGKVYIDEHRFRFNTKGVVSSYTGTERTSIPHSVGVVACISQPFNKGCNLIRQVETRIDSQQYTSFLMEIVSSYPTVGLISIVHDKYPVHNSTKVKSWLAGQQRMSVFSYWPPASGDLMPIETVFLDILKEFDEHETRVHSVKALWEEIQNAFAAVTEKEDYVKNLISKIFPNLRKIAESNGEML